MNSEVSENAAAQDCEGIEERLQRAREGAEQFVNCNWNGGLEAAWPWSGSPAKEAAADARLAIRVLHEEAATQRSAKSK